MVRNKNYEVKFKIINEGGVPIIGLPTAQELKLITLNKDIPRPNKIFHLDDNIFKGIKGKHVHV